MYTFKLYVVGKTPRSMRAIEALKRHLEADFKDMYSLDVIDLLRDPGAGDKDMVLATPTAIRVSPPPERRILGDFTDKERVFSGLGLKPDWNLK